MTDSFVKKCVESTEIDRTTAREVAKKRVMEGLGFMAAPTIALVAMHAVYPGTASEAVAAASGVAMSIGIVALREFHKMPEKEDEI